MPFFSETRKRWKHETLAVASPHKTNAPSAFYQQQPQWTAQPAPSSGLAHDPRMYSAVSLPTSGAYTQPAARPLHHQHTWSDPQTGSGETQPATHATSTDMCEKIGDKLGDVISLIDEEAFTGSTGELAVTLSESDTGNDADAYPTELDGKRAFVRREPRPRQTQEKQVNVFGKVDLYMNSRLPASLRPLRVYIPTYPLLCLAAQYSASAYYSPQSPLERKDYVSADNRLGTKAMVVKSIPCDDRKTIVFAIRGTSMLSIRDWGVNLSTDPVSPAGFLDDQGNLCHSGFLKVAKAMLKPIAARLRQILEEDPSRTSCSLLITGHSAGGAVASLLYSHMLAETVQSELNILTNCFKRVHCVTFGSPPISLLPLQKPVTADGRLRKCLFHSFINEGDPVTRAERAYIKSLVDLLSKTTVPTPSLPGKSTSPMKLLGASMSRLDLSLTPAKKTKPKPVKSKPSLLLVPHRRLWWEVPPATLSNAGRLVVMRVPDGGPESAVTASIVDDEQLRKVVFGDPLAHAMQLYATRIETLAVRAVTGRGGAC